jgi:8-oxo-dGTP pyrophosphatase MutT (NUDIX family)
MRNVLESLQYVSSVGVLLHTGGLLSTDNHYPQGYFLMIEREDDPPGTVAFPAGRVEKEETPEEAAVREIWEEVNVDIASLPLQLIVSLSKIKPKDGKLISQKRLYSCGVDPDVLWKLTDWKVANTIVSVQETPWWDVFYQRGAPKQPNDEVRNLLLFDHMMLLHFSQHKRPEFLPQAAPLGFFKDEIITAVSSWAWKVWLQNLRKRS